MTNQTVYDDRPERMIYHFIVLSHWNITPQVQSYDIPPGHINLTTCQPAVALNYPLYVEHLTRDYLISLVWLGRESKTWPSDTEATCAGNTLMHTIVSISLHTMCWFLLIDNISPQVIIYIDPSLKSQTVCMAFTICCWQKPWCIL